jgi:hypothetical protein
MWVLLGYLSPWKGMYPADHSKNQLPNLSVYNTFSSCNICIHNLHMCYKHVLFNSAAGSVSGRSKEKQKEDTFGQNDEDWHVYRTIVSSY